MTHEIQGSPILPIQQQCYIFMINMSLLVPFLAMLLLESKYFELPSGVVAVVLVAGHLVLTSKYKDYQEM